MQISLTLSSLTRVAISRSLEKEFPGYLLKSPLDYKEIKPVNLKGNQPWIFIRRTAAEAEKDWPPDVKSWFIGKDPDARKEWRQKEKRAAQDKMVR